MRVTISQYRILTGEHARRSYAEQQQERQNRRDRAECVIWCVIFAAASLVVML